MADAPMAAPVPFGSAPVWPMSAEGMGATPNDDGNRYGPGPAPYTVWADVEYLMWWVRPGGVTSPLASIGPPSTIGIIGPGGASVAIGDSHFDYGMHSGVRIQGGVWFDESGQVGWDIGGFFTGDETASAAVGSNAAGGPAIARPIINALNNHEASYLVAFPGSLAGTIVVRSSNELWGMETNFVGSLYRSHHFTADMLIGFRYVGMNEDLSVDASTTELAPSVLAFNGKLVPVGSTVSVTDRFETKNDFYGGQLGLRMEGRFNRVFVDLAGKFAVGNVHEVVNATGSTTFISPAGAVSTLPGGLLAVASNNALHSRDDFTYLPQAEGKLGVHVTDYITFTVGYSFLYWFDVARPGDQIDRTVNPTLVPSNLSFGTHAGPALPTTYIHDTGFWAQGINLGLEIRY
jgi:hypothetical protein